MLNIWFGNVLKDNPNYIYNTSDYFNFNYEEDWITSDFGRSIIKDIDKSEVLGGKVIDSPVLGAIPPEKIAGGTKAVLLMKFDDTGMIFNASTCGDNCSKWIQKIAEEKDLTIRLGHYMKFIDPFKAKVLNTGEVVTNTFDLLVTCHKLLRKG